MTNKVPLYFVLAMAAMLLSLSTLVSCKEKDKEDNTVYNYSESTQTTLVKGFALQADANVLASLDSVHFTIDYDNGLIYNADSLPVGTDIRALKVKIDFLNTVHSAEFLITGATQQSDTIINYSTSSTKSIDFTGNTILKVISADQTQEKDYTVKVLVHKVNPDSLVWPQPWRRDLTGYSPNVVGHKAVKHGEVYRIMTYDGSESVLWTATSPNQGIWDKQVLDLPFTPNVPSLIAADELLYMLGTDGTLYSSPDGIAWSSAGVKWYSLIGAYGDRVLGIVGGAEGYYHDEYPHTDGFEVSAAEDDFPVSHSSNLVQIDNQWSMSPQAIIVGGLDRNGRVLNDVWGYDGLRWGKINNSQSSVPAVTDATLFLYYTFKALSGVRHYAQQATWYLMGGKQANGELNSTIYLSNTQGVTWIKGDSTIAQPSHMPKFYGAQAFVDTETLTASGAAAMPRRIQSPVISWECPYIYLFGGYNDQGALLPYMWRGVYNRLYFYPVY